jgi:hypothetical protein
MKNYNFRFIDDPENLNEGLTIEEIDFLQQELNLKLPETYTFYLQNAGKNSNVFSVENDIKKLKNFQKNLRQELDKKDLLKEEELFCFKYQRHYEELMGFDFESFYFFKLSENEEGLKIYLFYDKITNLDWLGYNRELYTEGFIQFINRRTEMKYKTSQSKTIIEIIFIIILAPILICYYIYEWIRSKF